MVLSPNLDDTTRAALNDTIFVLEDFLKLCPYYQGSFTNYCDEQIEFWDSHRTDYNEEIAKDAEEKFSKITIARDTYSAMIHKYTIPHLDNADTMQGDYTKQFSFKDIIRIPTLQTEDHTQIGATTQTENSTQTFDKSDDNQPCK